MALLYLPGTQSVQKPLVGAAVGVCCMIILGAAAKTASPSGALAPTALNAVLSSERKEEGSETNVKTAALAVFLADSAIFAMV